MRHLQLRVGQWMRAVFVDDPSQHSTRVRALRFLEEAVELAQACGLTQLDVVRVSRMVYSKPTGQPSAEIGGVMVTLAGLANSLDLQIQDCTATELVRIQAPELMERVRHRNGPDGDKLT